MRRSLQTRGKELNAALEEVEIVIQLLIRETPNVEAAFHLHWYAGLDFQEIIQMIRETNRGYQVVVCTEALRVSRNALLKTTCEKIALL